MLFKKGLIILAAILISFVLSNYYLKMNSNNHTEEGTKMEKVFSHTELRKTEMKTTSEYQVDPNKLLYKTDKNGIFKATYKFSHATQKDEQMVLYALLEGSTEPLHLTVNGKKEKYHIVNVPKNGDTTLHFSISDLPRGGHILYLCTEKFFNEKINYNDLAKKGISAYFAPYYFHLQVGDEKVNNVRKQDVIKPEVIKPISVKKIEKGGEPSIRLFHEKDPYGKLDSVNSNSKYYISIKNTSKYPFSGSAYLLSGYEVSNINNSKEGNLIEVPPLSKVDFPLDLQDFKLKDSLRIIYVGIPEAKVSDVQFPVRVFFNTERLSIDNKLKN